MIIKQQLIQQLKLNWLLTLVFKKNIIPNRLTISASSIYFEKNYFIVKYKIFLIIPRFKKICYSDIKEYKTIFKRKNILSEMKFNKISNKTTTPEKKKEIIKILYFKILITLLLIFIVSIFSIIIAFFI